MYLTDDYCAEKPKNFNLKTGYNEKLWLKKIGKFGKDTQKFCNTVINI